MTKIEFALDKPVVVIGRSPQADVVIPDKQASRRHVEIRLINDRFSIVDLDSTNGTFVNDVRIQGTQALNVGDEIRIGSVVFCLKEGLAHAGQTSPVPDLSAWKNPSARAWPRLRFVGLGAAGLLLLALALLAGWLALRPAVQRDMTGQMTATLVFDGGVGEMVTVTRRAVVVAPTAVPVHTPVLRTVTARPTQVVQNRPTVGAGTPTPPPLPSSSPLPFIVSWSPGRYEGWADGRRMSSDLTIENLSLPELSPPYQPYFIVSDLSGAMRVGELHDYSSSDNALPALPPGQGVVWTWFTPMSDREWVRGSVFRYAGWSWAQEFNPDGSPQGAAHVISDQQLIPFLPMQISLEQLATALPALVPLATALPMLVPSTAP